MTPKDNLFNGLNRKINFKILPLAGIFKSKSYKIQGFHLLILLYGYFTFEIIFEDLARLQIGIK
jgi:hypothetical protein